MNSVPIIKSLPEITSIGRKTEARKLAVRTLEVVPNQSVWMQRWNKYETRNVYAGET